ncbi:biotin transporter BioY [Methanocaldococcus fervens]|uniref:BioY protein n=1 Tax=Methanocaldococcus fervens (strain DSM 4213 / JCM 15782 / AG86) TaxID=573064 RepID=C7P5F2_METFA|nr:biotin transporter BioY [Methanocaldococcus fervens]ACV25330.1 BioY protein [Methanocaldococcus fervens AG86]
MEIKHLLSRYERARLQFFTWRYNTSTANKFLLAFGLACLTGALAQIRIFLPWTPVPITGQTFSVLLDGVVLGRRWGGLSQAIYILLGGLGVPWFANFSGGFSHLLGPTGGYLIGFVVAALFIGYVVDKYVKSRNFLPMLAVMLFANFVIIYGFGLLGLGLWLALIKGSFPGIWELLWMGAFPFVPGDIIKAVLAASIAAVILPKQSFGEEVDA